jgi:hypothetical protein
MEICNLRWKTLSRQTMQGTDGRIILKHNIKKKHSLEYTGSVTVAGCCDHSTEP